MLQSEKPPPGYLRTTDLLGALSLASDLALGLPAGHAARSCFIGMHLADRLQLTDQQKASLFYAELLMDAGCTSWAGYVAAAIMGDETEARRDFFFRCDARNYINVLGWLQQYMAVGAPAHVRARRMLDFALHGKEFVREALKNTAEVAAHFAQQLGMPAEVQATLWSVFEQWDGTGPHGAQGELVPVTSRIVFATSLLEAFHSTGGRSAAIQLAESRRGKAFDPALMDVFLSVAREEAFWAGLEHELVWDTVLSMEPQSPYRYVREDRLESVATIFGDFADLKSFYSAGHSRRVADLAQRVARCMSVPEEEQKSIRVAGLLHDLGLVSVPSYTLHKRPADLTSVEWERIRLHPYHAERILARVSAFERIIPVVGAHHERMDGSGYYRGLSGSQIPLGARIIAVVDCFDELCHDAPDHPGLDPQEALNRMSHDAGKGLHVAVFDALTQELQADVSHRPASRQRDGDNWPSGLTDREVEILRLVARGLNRREMATQLYLSEHTVRHHLEHIYNKVGVSNRVAATLFAVERGLVH